VASTGPWRTSFNGEALSTTWDVYVVKDSSLVTPLTHEPAVLQGVGPAQSTWLGSVGPQGQPVNGPAVAWYDDPARWGVALTAGGLPSWPKATAATAADAPAVPVPKTTVTDIRTTDSSISFHVSRVGVPVTVKTSYFPNWQASGAKGPWRSAPNLMVVLPTSHDVTLTYGTTHANEFGEACTAPGVLVLVALGIAGVVRSRRQRSAGLAGNAGTGGPPTGLG
jgi:hypothetical protein